MKSRMLKQEYFINDQLGRVGPMAHLLYIGLLGLADREGRLEDRPFPIKVQILPYYDCNVDELLAVLFQNRLLNRYAIEGKNYIEIIDFKDHQRIHPKEGQSIIPAPISIAIPCNSGKSPGVFGDTISKGISNSISMDKEGECEGKPINTPVDNSPTPKPSKSKQQSATLPDVLPPNVEAARSSLLQWLKFKQERSESYKQSGLDALIGKLSKYEPATITATIEASMSCNWAGLFPEKITTAKTAIPRNESRYERSQRNAREFHEKLQREKAAGITQETNIFLLEE